MPRKNKYKQRADGRYYTLVNTGKYLPSGKPERIQVYGKTSKELEAKVENIRSSLKTNSFIFDCPDTVYAYAVKWMKTYKGMRGTNTRNMYENIIEKHIQPAIGDIKLSALSQSDVQGMISDRADKPRTCQQIKMTMKQIIKQAEKDRLLPPNNFICDVGLPRYRPKEKHPLSPEELSGINSAPFTDQERFLVTILYSTGIRREEAIALRRSDFDFSSGTLSITRAIIFDGNTPELKGVKSDCGNRVIPLPAKVIPTLQKYVDNCHTLYLITRKNGDILTFSGWRRLWESIQKKIGYPVTAHQFRHDYCTRLYYSGITIKKAVRLMGHTDTKMIMEIYAHLDEESEKAQEKIDSITQKIVL